MVPRLLDIVLGALLLVVMYCCMVWARFVYSVLVSVPMFTVSVRVGGVLVFVRVSVVVVLLPVLSLVVVCVSSCRNVAWFTSIPLMFMYSGSVL